MPTVATIGVYGFTLDRFLDTLRGADVRLLLDVRQRRGVRGSEYAWANSRRLQAALAEAGIAYRHHRELAPTTELRRLQYREDDRLGVGKRSRVGARAGLPRALRRGDPRPGGPRADRRGAARRGASALFCVERDPEACHRSLIAARLAHEHGVPVRAPPPGLDV